MDNRMHAVGADVGGSHISSAVIDLASGNAVTDPIVTDIDSRADACFGHYNPLIINRFSRGFLFPRCTKSVLNAKVYCKNRSRKERNDENFSQDIRVAGITFRILIWQDYGLPAELCTI